MKCNIHYLILPWLLWTTGCSESPDYGIEDEISAIENGLMLAVREQDKPTVAYRIADRMERHKVPGASIAVVRNGRIRWAKGYGIANPSDNRPIDTATLFQAGSISKPVAALAVLKLWERGDVDLDTDVNAYLTSWKVPESDHTANEKVTLRRLLTHTAGMTVHGFPGYQQSDTFPTDIEVLDGNGNTAPIRVDTIPGAIWRYSGGGYTVMEQVVENITEMSFSDFMSGEILGPIGMLNSTYVQPLPEELHTRASAAFDSDGALIEGLWNNYPEQAAAGLWTTPSDLARYCIAVQQLAAGTENGLLSPPTVNAMLTKHKNDWGLGPALSGEADSLQFGHGGKNAGFTNNMIAFAHTGDAVIVMTNADNGGNLMDEITRSVSHYYGWGINRPRMVETTRLTSEQLDAFSGIYQYDQQVPGIGDYLVEVSVDSFQLVVTDANNGQIDILTPLDPINFIDLEDGDEVTFKISADSSGFVWNGRFHFNRLNDQDSRR